MRATLLLAFLLLASAGSGCIVPENMTVLREELGYANVELPDAIVKIRAETLHPRVDEPVALTVQVDGVATDGLPIAWTLGDGTTATGQEIDHAWAEPGTYTVNATVTPAEGPRAHDAITITVTENQPPIPTISVESTTPAMAGTPVVLSAAESRDDDGDPLEHTWALDGEPAGIGPRLTHTFDAGVHKIQLTSDDGWEAVTTFHHLAVALPIQREASLDAADAAVEIPFTVEEDAEALTLTLTHTSQAGLEAVRITLVDGEGEPLAQATTDPAPGTSEATTTLQVGGEALEPGSYALEASLERGLDTTVTIEGILTYTSLPGSST
ncbi:MAG: PKD domain-containing protein [Candidatus Thermoplasmatota archaeon]|nr:PKD domain-containing protein [Candidatus Thermoplasmatota archaeon]